MKKHLNMASYRQPSRFDRVPPYDPRRHLIWTHSIKMHVSLNYKFAFQIMTLIHPGLSASPSKTTRRT